MYSHGNMNEESRSESSSRGWRNITIMSKVVATCIIAIPVQQHSLGRHIRRCNNVWRHAFEHRNEPLKFTVQIPTFRAALLQMSTIPDGVSCILQKCNTRTDKFTRMIDAYDDHYSLFSKIKKRYFCIS